jgi:hypothetical protein
LKALYRKISIFKAAFKFLLTTVDEVELLTEHDGVEMMMAIAIESLA